MPRGEADIVVIGAGAAGLAAAQRLAGQALSVLVLEAGSRCGGRGWTLADGSALDLGCGWLHSADVNPWTPIAEARGFAIDRTPPPWGTQVFNLGFSVSEQASYRAALQAFHKRVRQAAKEPQDRAVADLLEPGNRWNGLLNAVSSYVNGVEYDRLSLHDFAAYEDDGVNWRIVSGFGALVASHAGGLDVALDAPASVVDHGGRRIRVATPHGDVTAKAVIVTVSTGVLAAEGLRFSPPLPEKIEAAAGLPLGLTDKIFLAFDRPDEALNDTHLYGGTDRAGVGTYHLRPFGRPLIEGFFGGRLAADLEREGPAAFAAFAIDELAALLGEDIRKQLRPTVASAWGRDPLFRGSYSHALPGRRGERERLAAAVDGRLFFAGEACSQNAFSTAHGAYETGLRAAEEAMAALGSATGAPLRR